MPAFLAVTPLSDLRVVSSEAASEAAAAAAAADLFRDRVPNDDGGGGGGEGGPEVLPLVTGRGDPMTTACKWFRSIWRLQTCLQHLIKELNILFS